MNKDEKIIALQEEVRRLREVERAFSAVMEQLPIGITVADAPDGRIRAMTRYERELAQKPRRKIEGVSLEEYAAECGIFHLDGVTPARVEELPLYRAIHRGRPSRAKNGSLRPLRPKRVLSSRLCARQRIDVHPRAADAGACMNARRRFRASSERPLLWDYAPPRLAGIQVLCIFFSGRSYFLLIPLCAIL